MERETILVTSALPYANGPIHFGHIAGAYLPADVFVRYHRMLNNDVVYICGTDEYGVAITIGAEKEGRSPKEHVDKYHEVIKKIFQQFHISFDHFSRTTTEKHKELSQKMFLELLKNGHIETKETEQFYCSQCSRFLADRYVEGTCYICGFENARGDECPSCGTWLEPLKLKNPRCKICQTTPQIQKTRHWFLKLSDFKKQLHAWLDEHPYWKPNVLNVARSQIDQLESRPISRDLSWGIPVPLEEAKGKVLYVWFDAPIGYVDATMEWAERTGTAEKWKDYWQNSNCRIVNFIGKDNIPFHLLVWPSMLMGQTTHYTLAENIPANEFLNLQGRQFSKSEGWYIDLEHFFEKYTSDQIRYTLASMAPETKDSDFTWRDFQKFNNADLVGVLGNLVNRIMVFCHKNFEGEIPAGTQLDESMTSLLNEVENRKNSISGLFNTYQLKKAAYEVMDIARLGNRFFDSQKPWVTLKTDREECSKTLYTLFRLLEQLALVAWPIIPDTAESIFRQLGFSKTVKETGWNHRSYISETGGNKLGKAEILFKKIEDTQIEKEIEVLEKALKDNNNDKNLKTFDTLSPEISFDDFSKMDLRVGKILSAEPIKKSKKLMKLQVNLGFETRQIIAGIAEHYGAEELVGKQIVVVANLAPRKLMGETSQGMVLAAGFEDKLKILESPGIEPGARVR